MIKCLIHSMFDELKEVKYLKEITDFKRLINVKNFKEVKRLKTLQKAEVYLETKWAYTTELAIFTTKQCVN